MKAFEHLYLGAAYYPEDWPDEQMDQDIAGMKQAGLNVVRMAEFAWSRLEPREGEYDFAWLHRAVDKLGEAGIASVLGTPTATPPAWLTQKHPQVLVVNEQGIQAQHGARRHACPTNRVYRGYCEQIVRRMAQEFGSDPNVIAWQIDNELYPWGRGCCCSSCHNLFLRHLEERFGSIDALNQTWDTNLWSQTYQSFDQIPLPLTHTSHHPSLITEWLLFQSDCYADFATEQAELLHESATQPVGTDMMPFAGLDYCKVHRKLDFVQFNHYNDLNNLWEAGFWMDWCRPIKEKPFWVTETATCWGGGTVPGGYNPRGYCTANSWLPIALGGQANLYWLWRTHWAGHELMHGSVVATSGRPMHIFGEVQALAKGYGQTEDFVLGTRPVRSGLAIHMSTFSWDFFQAQPIVWRFDYGAALRSMYYRPVNRMHLRPDIIDPTASLDDYKVVISPFLPALDDGGLRSRLKEWIENGGTWIAGPLTDIRTTDSTKFLHAPFGSLEDWAGIRATYEIPATQEFHFTWSSGRESGGGVFYTGFELRGAEALATYTDYPFEGQAAVTRMPLGRGCLVLLGTQLQEEDLCKLIQDCCESAGVRAVAAASENLVVAPRSGPAGTGAVIVEIENKPGHIKLSGPAVDLLTGKELSGSIGVAPYGVLVLKDKAEG